MGIQHNFLSTNLPRYHTTVTRKESYNTIINISTTYNLMMSSQTQATVSRPGRSSTASSVSSAGSWLELTSADRSPESETDAGSAASGPSRFLELSSIWLSW